MDPPPLDDLLEPGDWRNLQEVVRVTFKALYDVIKAQTHTIRDLEQHLEKKAGAEECRARFAECMDQLRGKADGRDVAKMVHELKGEIRHRPLIKDVNRSMDQVLQLTDQKVQQLADQRVAALEHALGSNRLQVMQSHIDDLTTTVERLRSDHAILGARRAEGEEVGNSAVRAELKGLRREIDQVQSLLSDKASVEEVHSVVVSLDGKATISDVKRLHDAMARLPKADEMSKLRRSMEGKVAASDLAALAALVEAKVSQSEFDAKVARVVGKRTGSVSAEIRELSEQVAGLRTEVDSRLAGVQSRVDDQVSRGQSWGDRLERVKGEVLEELGRRLQEVVELRGVLEQQGEELRSKAQLDEVQSVLDNLQEETGRLAEELRAEFEAGLTARPTRTEVQDLIDPVTQSLTSKADIDDVNAALEHKANRRQLEELEQLLGSEDGAVRGTSARLDTLEERVGGSFQEVARELLLKVNVKDLMGLLDQKADGEELQQKIQEAMEELEGRVTRSEWRSAISDQALINEALCAEHSLGRWIWRSGEVRASGLVPWEVQVVNTCPDNFQWQQNSPQVVAAAPGLYEISFGIFGKRKGTVSVLVNQETVFVLSNATASVSVRPQQGASCTGLTLVEFLVLPPQAQLSLAWQDAGVFPGGKPGGRAEGFFAARKL
mmetsp:Transcript_26056/g.67129  ORF Transcript_26056/g.67129 Transcript_26056/m.67129 type:complete len:665 (+) Transcript_26056:2-1996(+)